MPTRHQQHPDEFSDARNRAMKELGKTREDLLAEYQKQTQPAPEPKVKQTLTRLFTAEAEVINNEILITSPKLQGFDKIKVVVSAE